VICYSTLAQGLLTGKFPAHPDFRQGDQRPSTVYYEASVYPHVHEAVTGMLQSATGSGMKLSQLALLWALRQPGIAGALVGARSVAQVGAVAEPADVHAGAQADVLERVEGLDGFLVVGNLCFCHGYVHAYRADGET
jgi:aryl-alcohol dehydrogenase-like predicted oxidoreductase